MQIEFMILDAIMALQTIVICSTIAFLVLTLKRARENNEAVSAHLKSMIPKLDEILEGVKEFVKAARPAGEQFVGISKDLKEIVESTRKTASTVSETVEEVSSTVRRQVSKADSIVTENMERIETFSDSIAEEIVGPLAEIAAILKGGAVAIKYLRGSRTLKVAHGNGNEGNGHDSADIL